MCTVYGSLEVIPISPYPHASLSEEIIGLDNTIMYYFARNGRSIGQWSSIMVKRVSGCYQKRKRTSNISPARHCNYAYTASSLSRSGMADDGRRPQQQSIPTQNQIAQDTYPDIPWDTRSLSVLQVGRQDSPNTPNCIGYR